MNNIFLLTRPFCFAFKFYYLMGFLVVRQQIANGACKNTKHHQFAHFLFLVWITFVRVHHSNRLYVVLVCRKTKPYCLNWMHCMYIIKTHRSIHRNIEQKVVTEEEKTNSQSIMTEKMKSKTVELTVSTRKYKKVTTTTTKKKLWKIGLRLFWPDVCVCENVFWNSCHSTHKAWSTFHVCCYVHSQCYRIENE